MADQLVHVRANPGFAKECVMPVQASIFTVSHPIVAAITAALCEY